MTLRCQAVLTKAGLPANDVYMGGGLICAELWAVEAALRHTPALSRESVLSGLFGAGLLQLPFPYSDATFRPPLKLDGGDTWWPVAWDKTCTCWRVLDATRHPSWP
jgi:hypothetical protein